MKSVIGMRKSADEKRDNYICVLCMHEFITKIADMIFHELKLK